MGASPSFVSHLACPLHLFVDVKGAPWNVYLQRCLGVLRSCPRHVWGVWGLKATVSPTPFFQDEFQELTAWGASAQQASGKVPQVTPSGVKTRSQGQNVHL